MEQTETRRERHKQQRLERIREAAWQLFSTQGYEATTVRQIAEQADVSPATVILHAGDKAELLLLVFHDAIAQRLGVPAHEDGAPLDVALLRQLQPFLHFYGEYPELSRAFCREFLYGKNRWQEQEIQQAQRFIAHLAGIIDGYRRRGELRRDTDPTLLAELVFGLYQGLLQSWFCGAIAFESLEPRLAQQFRWQLEVHRA